VPDPIIRIVVDLLDTEGYEAVRLREVARRGRMSLATIYKEYPTRDELIVAALRWWMDTHHYSDVPVVAADDSDEPMYGASWRYSVRSFNRGKNTRACSGLFPRSSRSRGRTTYRTRLRCRGPARAGDPVAHRSAVRRRP
jgi:AcrR family transcriptional regulator